MDHTLRLRVLDLRLAAGLSQTKLANSAGVRQATVSAIERNLTRQVDLDLLEKLAEVLGVAPSELFVDLPRPEGSAG